VFRIKFGKIHHTTGKCTSYDIFQNNTCLSACLQNLILFYCVTENMLFNTLNCTGN